MNKEMLKDVMEKKNMSITTLAETAKINKSTLSRILSGENECNVSTAGKIAAALNLSNKTAYLIFFAEQVAQAQEGTV